MTDPLQEAAKAIWDAWQASPCCPESNRGLSWANLLAGADTSPLLKDIADTGIAEAKAAILAYLRATMEPSDAVYDAGCSATLSMKVAFQAMREAEIQSLLTPQEPLGGDPNHGGD